MDICTCVCVCVQISFFLKTLVWRKALELVYLGLEMSLITKFYKVDTY